MRKRLLAIALSAVLAVSGIAVFPQSAEAYTDSSLGSKLIGRVGSSNKSFYKGSDFELEVRKGKSVKENNIKWSIENTAIVKFDDDDRTDDEIELRAVKVGTTKVTAKNLLTGGKIVYTVKVKNPSYTISRVGEASRTVRVGNEFELKVRKNGGISDSHLYWTTSNKNIVKVADNDRSDDEIDLKAVAPGTAKITCKNKYTGGKIVYTVTVKKASMLISRVGNATKTVEVGDDLELSVKKSGLKESQIKWTIADTSILRFEDGDNVGSEIEVEAKKRGTTKVTAKNLYTGGKIVYTVKVTPDYDD
jgi:phage-related protein